VAIRKWPVVIILMAVAVPSGCLPVATVGSAIEAARVPRSRRLVDEQKRTASVGAAVVLGLLSAASLLVYGYLWRRTFAEPNREVMGLRKAVWRVLLVLSQGVGVAIGLVILFQSP
jgi:hypothetical protein